MKKWLNLLYILTIGMLLMTAVIGCESADAQQSKQDSLSLTNGAYREPGPDGNPATYDQNPDNPPLSTVRTYDNVDGNEIQSPTAYKEPPPGTCAICRDGTYSQSKHRQGTCSHHGGVKEWLKDLPK